MAKAKVAPIPPFPREETHSFMRKTGRSLEGTARDAVHCSHYVDGEAVF